MGIAQYTKLHATEFHFLARREVFILNFTSKPTIALTEPSCDRQDRNYSSTLFKTNTSPFQCRQTASVPYTFIVFIASCLINF